MNALYDAARRAQALPDLWRAYGLPLAVHNDRFATSTTPCCGESNRKDAGSLFLSRQGDWRWHCFRCGQGGTAIDLVAEREGLSHKEAAKKLVADNGGFTAITGQDAPKRAPRTSGVDRQAAIAKIITAIKESKAAPNEVFAYLRNVRGISEATLTEAWKRGLLRALPGNPDAADTWLRLNCTEETLRQSGMLKGRFPAAAYRPVVFLPWGGSSVEFRVASREVAANAPKALQYGEQTYPLVWGSSGDVQRVILVEGGIDMLSLVDLGLARNAMVLGLLGVSAWQDRWVEGIRAKHPKATWQVAFDADHAGNEAAPPLIARLTEAGIAAERLAPWGAANDWNDVLLAARQAF